MHAVVAATVRVAREVLRSQPGELLEVGGFFGAITPPRGGPPNIATAWIEKRAEYPNASLALYRHGLVHCHGLFIARGWSQLIIDRWRNAASSRPAQPETSGVGLNTGVGFSSNPRRGGYHGMHVPGA